MKKQELKKLFLSELGSKLKPYGFTLVGAMDWYVQKQSDSSKIYQLAFSGGYNQEIGYLVSPALAIRVEEVEDIFHQVSGFEKKYQRFTPTINPTVQSILGRKDDLEFQLDGVDHLPDIVDSLFKIFVEIALPFFDQHSSLSSIERLLNENPEKESIYYPGYLRCYHGVITAKLVERPDYDQIEEIYRKYLSQDEGYYLKDYERLIDLLKRTDLSQ